MKKSSVILILLLTVLVVACVPKQSSQPEVAVESENDIETLPEETVLEPTEVESTEVAVQEQPPVKPIGTQFKSHSEEAPKKTPAPAIIVAGVINLTKQKTMSADLKVITIGETLTWKNENAFAHQLVVELNGVRISDGRRMNPGEAWSFTFDKQGEYLVRDIFSGNMRMLVRVEP
ncbi:hypothetical protein HY772_06590 [Candidatus Woesearchaeota archaeon]|nr:hypothetical protein [Candidatus Woesearchaeota archaeon]